MATLNDYLNQQNNTSDKPSYATSGSSSNTSVNPYTKGTKLYELYNLGVSLASSGSSQLTSTMLQNLGTATKTTGTTGTTETISPEQAISDTQQKVESILPTTGGITTTSDGVREQQAEEEDIALAQMDKEIQTLTKKQQIAQLKSDLGISEAPETLSLTDTYTSLRDQYNLSSLETQLSGITNQIKQLEADKMADVNVAETQLASRGLISKEQAKITADYDRALNNLYLRQSAISDSLNTANSIISTIMDLKQADYQLAKQAYDDEFSNQLTLLEMVNKEQDEATSAAQANLNTIMNMTSGMSWDELTASTQAQIQKLELQSGLPSGITQSFYEQLPDAEILTTSTSYDADGNQIISFIYKGADGKVGTVETVYTGGVAYNTLEEEVPEFTLDDINTYIKNTFSTKQLRDQIEKLWQKGVISAQDYKDIGGTTGLFGITTSVNDTGINYFLNNDLPNLIEKYAEMGFELEDAINTIFSDVI